MSSARLVAAVLAAAATAVPMIVLHEGYRDRVYADPAPGAYPTACFGQRVNEPLGKQYTRAQCEEFLAIALATHGAQIAKCLPAELPNATRAAFTSFGYNVGSARFCSSSLARKANAGDLRGACLELDRWTYAGTKQLPGLVKRRAAEKALCLQGLLRGPG
jgi:lysozyme